jgi:hypothetical protein
MSVNELVLSLLPVPLRTAPHRSTLTTRYVNFTAGGTNSGTLANPYNNAAGVAAGLAAMVAGDAMLFCVGTTSTITATLAAATGTSVAPVVFGVYDPATGNRISGQRGIAIISCGGGAFAGATLANKNWTCVEGLSFISNSGANSLVSVTGTSGNCQILNCQTTNPGQYGIFVNASGGNNVVDGNLCTGGSNGIWLQMPGPDTTSIVIYNTVRSVVERGIFIYDGYSSFAASVTVACNTVEDGTDNNTGGIEFVCAGGASKVYRNTARRFASGIRAVSSLSGSTLAANFSGFLIQNNDVANNEFGILLTGAYGSWSIEFNRVYDSGSKTGATWITPSRWGRGIELFGATPAVGCSDGTVRFNFVTGSYNWPGVVTEGSEGIGIGLDDNTRNVAAYGNFCTLNEGSGFNVNGGGGQQGANNLVFGNICVANCTLRPGRVLNWAHPSLRSEIHQSVCNYSKIFNNTLVSTVALYSYADFSSFASNGSEIFNNLMIGAKTAAIRRDTGAGKTSESYNVIIGAAAAVVNLAGAPIALGTGTVLGSGADADFSSQYYTPRAGGRCDSTGTTPPAGTVDFAGYPLADKTPIGALHAV